MRFWRGKKPAISCLRLAKSTQAKRRSYSGKVLWERPSLVSHFKT